jgi:aminocarboxymuconate-semialdehyde decarboxylase
MRIDVHAHLFSERYVDALRSAFRDTPPPLGEEVKRLLNWWSTDPRMTKLDLRLEEMDRYGIDMQILSLGAFHGVLLQDRGVVTELAHIGNDVLVDAATRYPDKFRVLAALPVNFPDLAIQELDRLAGRPEVVGVNLVGSASPGVKPLNDPDLFPLYAELERRGIPFLLHPVTAPGLECMMELSLANIVGFMFETTLAAVRMVYGGVFERYPGLTMIFPHLGGTAPYLMGRIQWGYERFPICNEQLTMPPLEYFKRFYYDTVTRNVPALQMGLSMFGVDHVMFGTDIPLREDIDLMLQDLQDLGLSEADLEAINSGNATRVLGL